MSPSATRSPPIPDVPGLSALEIDPEQAADAYRERIIGPVRGLLPDKEIASITEQLSGSCTTEVASFNEFTALLADEGVFGQYDHVLFDTAPTGHTIRLLQLPGSWTDFLNEGKGDASCLGPLAGLDKQRTVYADAVAALKDPARTRLVLVTRAQASALAEVARTNDELAQIGITATHLIVNGVLPDGGGRGAARRRRRETARRPRSRRCPQGLPGCHVDVLELKSANMIGLPALRLLLGASADTRGRRPRVTCPRRSRFPPTASARWSTRSRRRPRTRACAWARAVSARPRSPQPIAVTLARRGHEVHLTTTDPAAHVEETLHGAVEGLRVSRIDPVEATREYRDRIMATKGKNLDDAGRAALHEDLLSPCTEEVAVFGSSPAWSPPRGTSSWSSTPRPPATPSCSSTRPGPTTATSSGRWARRHGLPHPDDDAPGPGADEGRPRHPSRADSRDRGPRPAGRPRARRHPPVGLGRQHLPCRGAAAVAVPAATGRGRGRADRGRRVLADRVAVVPLLDQEPVGEARLASVTAHEREPA